MRKVLLLPGDGIGPEVVAPARQVLELVAAHLGGLQIEQGEFGGCAIDSTGDPLPDRSLAAALEADAVLLGAVGGPSYDRLPAAQRPEKGLLRLRERLEVFANLRPVTAYPELQDSSSLRAERLERLDLLIVRELTGGIYFAGPRGIEGEGDERVGFNTMKYSVAEIKRIAQVAFDAGKRRQCRVCSVDKANVLEVSMLWREIVTELAAADDAVELEHMYVDNAAMQMVRNPGHFDVIVTSNLFGDILSDLGAELSGSIGMLPSASLGAGHGLYEPVHGSAPEIAGKDIANPCATILSVAMMVEHTFADSQIAGLIRGAVRDAIGGGLRTADIAGGRQAVSGSELGKAINDALRTALNGRAA